MPSESSPLLSPRSIPIPISGSSLDDGSNPQPYHGSPGSVTRNQGFSNSFRRSSVVVGSIGRASLLDSYGRKPALDDSPGLKPTTSNASEVHRLAREQQELLRDNSLAVPSFENVGPAEEYEETEEIFARAVAEGKVTTSTLREAIVLSKSAVPLTITFCLQYSLTVASIFSVGHLGKSELAAVSLAVMTANITGFALIQGLATCLDTLCPQAFGAGKKMLVGEYFVKCTVMILCIFIPIAIFWTFSAPALSLIVPEQELVLLVQEYLRIVALGTPAYILFETGKRYVQAQGIFHASTIVLLICAPLNAILNYTLVWNPTIGMGYAGAPTAVVITDWTMVLLLFLYVRFVDGMECWGGLQLESIFKNWSAMFNLAIPGVIMIEAEFLAFEILTLISAYFGTASLAAQSVLSTITSLTYQIPFALSIAGATRIANFVGARLPDSAKKAAYVSMGASYLVAFFNTGILFTFRYDIGALFSNDEDVIELVGGVLPVCALCQLFDSTGCVAGGALRGQGRQRIGGYLNLFAYYAIALPLALVLAFTLDMKLEGLWTAIGLGLLIIMIGETAAVMLSDWPAIINEAHERNKDGVTALSGH